MTITDIFQLLTALITLITTGDYLGTLATFGIEEDSALVDAILTARETATSSR